MRCLAGSGKVIPPELLRFVLGTALIHPRMQSKLHRISQPSRIAISTLLATVVFVIFASSSTEAHAFVAKSDPAASAVLATAPTQMTIWFTERLEPKSTSATLSDHLGNTIAGTSFRIGDDPKVLIVTFPSGLANGTYSVVWKNISEDDGHPAKGYVPFTIGTAADVQAITAPTESTGAA